jgi:MFS family permease
MKFNSASPQYRWVVLALYAWVAGLSQLLWLNFAPILSSIQSTYAVSESVASLLLLVFPLTYVLLSMHAGSLIDMKGYKFAIGLGCILMAIFSSLRIYTGNFWVLLIAQTGISLGQPYILNGITKLVLDWFPAEHIVLATGLGTVGLFVGMALGLAVTPPLVNAFGLTTTMLIFAVVTCLSSAAFLFFCKSNKSAKAEQQSAGIDTGFWQQLYGKSRNNNLLLLFFISFIGLGYFNGLTSWIEAILAPNGIDSVQAGIVGGILILGGIFGAAIIPALSDHYRKRKPFLLLSIIAATITLIPLCRSHSYSTLMIWAFLQGFFFLPAYALLLDMASLDAGEKWAGSATGVLMLAGNAGGVLAIIILGAMKEQSPDFASALYFLLALLITACVASLFTRDLKLNQT